MDIAFLIPSLPTPGGGNAFNDGMIPALRALGHRVTPGTRLEDRPGVPVIDGLLLPSLEHKIEALVARDAVCVVHHVSAAAGRDHAGREAVQAVERRLLPRLRRVVATSQPVADRLREAFGVASPIVLLPGHAELARSIGSGGGCAILAPGVLTPRKGNDRLLTALARLVDLDWTLTIAGDAGRDPAHAAALAALVTQLGLEARVTLLPDPDADQLEALWRGADLVASATAWEGYPAALAEAIRRGVPVVAPRLPGIEAVIPDAAGVLYGTDDAATFGKCLRRALFDGGLRAALADGAWLAGEALPGWAQQAAAFVDILAA